MQALRRLAPVLALIEQELADGGPGVAALALAADVSRSRLHTLFRTALGRSPLQHILACRLRLAQRLLIGSDLAIAAVAARAGYGDAFHFSRTFRRVCGESPSDYRRRGLANQA
jgi:transcriptional regulator GlxA family with amidase domain